jgi:hypothetical protein
MKKILFITLLFCGLAFTAQSQSLTYSKVILLTYLELDTVPQGKVWKVVSYQTAQEAGSAVTIKINGTNTYAYSKYFQSNSMIVREIPFPMWFPAGTTIQPWSSINFLNIIEFTENNE